MYLNKATIIGNLTKDPELKALPSGNKVVSLSVATNRTWKDANGAKQESVEFHNVIAFGKQAEVIAQYLKKGNQALFEGRLQTRTWDKDEVKHYRTEIVVENFQFGNNKKESSSEHNQDRGNEVTQTKPESKALGQIEYPEEEINLNDIPF